MNKDNERIIELTEILKKARWSYYMNNEAIITDAEYDALEAELADLEGDSAPADSPTQTVGPRPTGMFSVTEHTRPMYSLAKVGDIAELRNWIASLKGARGSQWLLEMTYKADGIAVKLHFAGGMLVGAATRGDGRVGEDITHTARLITSIPPSIAYKGYLEVRGEIVASNSLFEAYNERLRSKNLDTYASPRNFASGAVRTLEPDLERLDTLMFIPYGMYAEGSDTVRYRLVTDEVVDARLDTLERQSEVHKALGAMGFERQPALRYAENAKLGFLQEALYEMERDRDELEYDVDGVVLRLNDHEMFEDQGYASNSPNGAVAWKFATSTALTRLTGVEWQVGRTGVITPRADLAPVQVGDVTVSSATLHNAEQIARLGLMIGDTVVVKRAGEVIPAVEQVKADMRDGSETNISVPSVCPSCGSSLFFEGPKLYCANDHCPAQAVRKIEHFVGRDYMDVDGCGPTVIATLVDGGFVSDAADMYRLNVRYDELCALEGMGEVSVSKLLTALEESKRRPLHRVLASLGITEVGRSASRIIAKATGDMTTAMNMTAPQISALPDIGPLMARYYVEYMAAPESRSLIARLAAAGVNMTEPEAGTNRGGGVNPFDGKTVVVTGALVQYKRPEIQQRLRDLGAKSTGSVSKNTDYLIVGERPGSKLVKATSLGVPVLTEAEFTEMTAGV